MRFLKKARKQFTIMEQQKIKNDTQIKMSKVCNYFAIVKNENGKYNICAGQYKISDKSFDMIDQAERYIGTKPYEIICNLIALFVKLHEDEKASKTKKSTKKSAKNPETDK